MSFATIEELETAIISAMGSLGSSTSASIITQGAQSATIELGWDSFPIDNSSQEYWLIERGRRHTMMTLCVEAASKFQFKKIYLQHRFANYFKLIESLDKIFEKSVENDPVLFSDLSGYGSDGSYFINGLQYITPGFQYDGFGNDLTYVGDNTTYLEDE